MNKEKILKVDEGVLAYYMMQHIFRNKASITFTKEYMNQFLNGFLLNSAKDGYTLHDRNNKEVDTTNDKEFSNFVKNTTDMICYKYAKKVDDLFDEYCFAHEFVHPLRWLYDAMPKEMFDCVISFENALTLESYTNEQNLKIIEDEYYSKSLKMHIQLKKEQEEKQKNQNKDEDDKDIYAKAWWILYLNIYFFLSKTGQN